MTPSSVHTQRDTIKWQVSRAGEGHYFIVASAADSVSVELCAFEIYSRIARFLNTCKAEIVHERIFGSLYVESVVHAFRRKALSAYCLPVDNPITYIQGQPPRGNGFAGVIIHAVSTDSSKGDIWDIKDGDEICGRGWRRGNTSCFMLQNIHGIDGSGVQSDHSTQTLRMFERAERILRQQGACYRDVVRTWIYLSDILSWYPDFNQARNSEYKKFGIIPGCEHSEQFLPASTGIQGDNPFNSACCMDLLAVSGPENEKPFIRRLSNPGQKDAFLYGSAFSRGALISDVDMDFIQISGTAAIDETGAALFPDDIRSQIHCTFDKIELLLSQVGADFEDVCAATVFVKRAEDIEIFRQEAEYRGLSNLPFVCVTADICRDELLFEIDAEAVINREILSFGGGE